MTLTVNTFRLHEIPYSMQSIYCLTLCLPFWELTLRRLLRSSIFFRSRTRGICCRYWIRGTHDKIWFCRSHTYRYSCRLQSIHAVCDRNWGSNHMNSYCLLWRILFRPGCVLLVVDTKAKNKPAPPGRQALPHHRSIEGP